MAGYQSSHTGLQIDTCVETYQNASQVSTTVNNAITNAVTSINATMNAAISSAIAEAKLAMFPIGSIYISTTNNNPGNFIGGTWDQIEDRFLLAAGSAYNAGDTGGEVQHTLTTDEMPAHAHTVAIYGSAPGWNNSSASYSNWGGQRNNSPITSDSVGGGEAHNNMPPYLVVYVWKRRA